MVIVITLSGRGILVWGFAAFRFFVRFLHFLCGCSVSGVISIVFSVSLIFSTVFRLELIVRARSFELSVVRIFPIFLAVFHFL